MVFLRHSLLQLVQPPLLLLDVVVHPPHQLRLGVEEILQVGVGRVEAVAAVLGAQGGPQGAQQHCDSQYEGIHRRICFE